MIAIHQAELHWIRSLHNVLRNPITDTFFTYWDFVDSASFVIAFVCAIMYLFNRKEGISLLFIFILSSFTNALLKQLFHLPRPGQIDPSVGLLCLTSFGFPSGAAQTATIVAGLALAKCQSILIRIVAAVFALTLCFSRIFLGVHFFTDVLGGIGVGLALVWIYLKLFPLIEKHFAKFAFCLSAFFLLGGKIALPLLGFSLGSGIGLLFAKKIQLSQSRIIRFFTFLFVAVVSAILGSLKRQPLGAVLTSFWFVYLGSQFVEIVVRVCQKKVSPFS